MAKIGLVSKNTDRQKVPHSVLLGHFLGHLLDNVLRQAPDSIR